MARARAATAYERRYESARVGTDELFFQRLRRQAKWMFVLLALVFAVGFVAFGVGSDVQGGLADIVQGRGTSDQPSADEARDRLRDNPRDRQALRDLATALQTEGNVEEAIRPLERLARLEPRNEDVQRELAGVYLTRATRLRNEVQQAQLEAQVLAPSQALFPPASSPAAQAFMSAPLEEAISAQLNERLTNLFGRMQGAYGDAKDAYAQVAKLTPRDASVQLQLADAAQNAGDIPAAITAYKRYLELAPDDPFAPQVRAELKRLQATPSTPTGG